MSLRPLFVTQVYEASLAAGPGFDAFNAGLADAALEAFLSPEVQSVLAAKAFVAPVNPAATKPAGFPDSATLFAPDWAHFAKGRPGWIERWNRELL